MTSAEQVVDEHVRNAGGRSRVARLWENSATPPKGFALLTMAELYARPSQRWLIHGVLPAQGFGAIYGESGAGKGFLIVDIVAALCEGRAWFGRRVKAPRRVVYVVLEGQDGLSKRFKAWEIANERPFPEAVRFVFQQFQLFERCDVLGLAASIDAEGGADVIVIDTLNRAAPGADENSAQDMGRILQAVKDLQAMTGGLVLLVHHSGKDASKGMRGHSSLHAALDCAIAVSHASGVRQWGNAKQKDERDGDAYTFELRRVEIDRDEYGEPITSCVVDAPAVDLEPVPQRPKLPKGGNQKIVYDALCPLFRESRTFGKAGAPALRPCLALEDAIASARDRLIVDPKRRTERAQEAIRGLVASGVLGSNEGWLWLI